MQVKRTSAGTWGKKFEKLVMCLACFTLHRLTQIDIDRSKTFKASWSEVLMSGVSGQRRWCCVSLTVLPMFLTVGYFYDRC